MSVVKMILVFGDDNKKSVGAMKRHVSIAFVRYIMLFLADMFAVCEV